MTNIDISYFQNNNKILIRDSRTGRYEEVQIALPKNHIKQEEVFIIGNRSIAAHIAVQIASA